VEYHCVFFFFFSSRRRHTRSKRDWSSDVCSSDLALRRLPEGLAEFRHGLSAAGGVEHVAFQGNDRKRRVQLAVVQDGACAFRFRSEERRVGKECRCRGPSTRERDKSRGEWVDAAG